MIKLGKVQKLEVEKKVTAGVYLISDNKKGNERVLLPKGEMSAPVEVGQMVEVFVYKDSEDRIIATTKKPKLTLGEIASLQVVETTKIGAFLDWGLKKDLFLPFREQKVKVQKGRWYLVGLYIDKTDRLSATMDVYKVLSSDSPFKQNDKVEGVIYSLSRDLGAFVAVDNKYHGLIPNKELFGNFNPGDKVEAVVSKVRNDGKLDLSLRNRSYKNIDKDAIKILKTLQSKGGVLMLNDKSHPNKISDELKMSKSSFKKAVGRLLKENKIKFIKNGIELID